MRHGRPLVDPTRPAHEWRLDPVYDDDVRALRDRLPAEGRWFSSPEPKAFMTARLLTEEPIEVDADLREHERDTSHWIDDFDAVMARAFAQPERPAYDGWVPLVEMQQRVVRVVAELLTRPGETDLVLVGHATSWACVIAELAGRAPEFATWANLTMPDVVECANPRAGVRCWVHE